MTISDRLKEALMSAGRTTRSLQRELKERKVRGSGYGSVYDYVNGKTDPPLEFVEAAAEVLGVRLEWLRHGEGEMTETEEEFRRLEEEALAQEPEWAPLFKGMYPHFLEERTAYDQSWLGAMRKTVLVAFMDTWGRMYQARNPGEDAVHFSAEFGVELFKSMMRPLELAAPGKEVDPSSQEFTDYALSMFLAMNQAVRVPVKEND